MAEQHQQTAEKMEETGPSPDSEPMGGELMVAAQFGFKVKVPKNLHPLMHWYRSNDVEKRKEIRHTQLRGGHHPQTGCCYSRRDHSSCYSYRLRSTYFVRGALNAQRNF